MEELPTPQARKTDTFPETQNKKVPPPKPFDEEMEDMQLRM